MEPEQGTSASSYYVGPIMRGVDYSPTWPGWAALSGTQTGDSDFANDAFGSLWNTEYVAPPQGDPSSPVENANYRGDLTTISGIGFNLVRLYDWHMARGTTATSNTGLDHINFLNAAASLGLKVVVPVADNFLGEQYAWNGATPDSAYSFGSAPASIQQDFIQLVSSIIDPATGNIHAAVHSISVGNEGDIGQDIGGTTAANFLARTLWWIVNLNQQINGPGTGPDGNPVVNSASPVIMLSATFSDADQGGSAKGWFYCLVNGVDSGQATPNGCALGATFSDAVTGLAAADAAYTSYYYNSVNVTQVDVANNSNNLQATLQQYDSGDTTWPGGPMGVPLLFMEVFAPNRGSSPAPYDQATAAVNQVTTIEAYIQANDGGQPSSTTWLMGYNYFELNDEPAPGNYVGLYGYGSGDQPQAQTGTTSLFYSSFPTIPFPVSAFVDNPGPNGKGTLATAISACWPSAADLRP
jgi:hypothetical protein